MGSSPPCGPMKPALRPGSSCPSVAPSCTGFPLAQQATASREDAGVLEPLVSQQGLGEASVLPRLHVRLPRREFKQLIVAGVHDHEVPAGHLGQLPRTPQELLGGPRDRAHVDDLHVDLRILQLQQLLDPVGERSGLQHAITMRSRAPEDRDPERTLWLLQRKRFEVVCLAPDSSTTAPARWCSGPRSRGAGSGCGSANQVVVRSGAPSTSAKRSAPSATTTTKTIDRSEKATRRPRERGRRSAMGLSRARSRRSCSRASSRAPYAPGSAAGAPVPAIGGPESSAPRPADGAGSGG